MDRPLSSVIYLFMWLRRSDMWARCLCCRPTWTVCYLARDVRLPMHCIPPCFCCPIAWAGPRHYLYHLYRTNLAEIARVLAASSWVPVRLLDARQAAAALMDDAPLARFAVEAFAAWVESLLAALVDALGWPVRAGTSRPGIAATSVGSGLHGVTIASVSPRPRSSGCRRRRRCDEHGLGWGACVRAVPGGAADSQGGLSCLGVRSACGSVPVLYIG